MSVAKEERKFNCRIVSPNFGFLCSRSIYGGNAPCAQKSLFESASLSTLFQSAQLTCIFPVMPRRVPCQPAMRT